MSTLPSNETCDVIRKHLEQMGNTVNAQALRHAAHNGHPLLIAMDSLLRAARTYSTRFESTLAEDYVLGPDWLAAAKGVRGLLDGDFGPIDSGTVEEIFWRAMDAAGFTEADL